MTDHGLDMSVIEPYLQAHPYPRIFLTVSGAHLYGFASPDSDYDLRGCHLIPARDMLRISTPRETYEVLDRDAPIEMDIVTHDARKYFDMLVGKNGYVLEQIFSPLVIEASDDLEELKDIARSCITRHHRHHFRSFASKQWDNVANAANRTVKGLLYTYRPLMAGIHLMRTGEIESNLRTLNTSFAFPFIDELIDLKINSPERSALSDADMSFHKEQFDRLGEELERASEASGLPELPAGRERLEDFLVRIRLRAVS